jgi:cephalosporin-C deacetylase-like acetyl esterase
LTDPLRQQGVNLLTFDQALMGSNDVDFARRMTAGSLWWVALMDEICPPSTVYAAYNAAPEPKTIAVAGFENS